MSARFYVPDLKPASGVAELPPDEAHHLTRVLRLESAQVEGAPASPGQYRRRGDRVEIHLRASSDRDGGSAARRVVVRFDGGYLESIEGADRRAVPRITLEPELLALLSGPQQEQLRS